MHPIVEKLNFKDQVKTLILNSPADFNQVVEELHGLSKVDQEIHPTTYEFILAFVKNTREIKDFATQLPPIIAADVILWIAYPKKSSRKYTPNISRDSGWQPLGDIGFEAVRQIAIDDDWSALRFRQGKFIKTLKRDKTRAMSKEGRRILNG